MNELEINWRKKEEESIRAKIRYLRYKQSKLDELGMFIVYRPKMRFEKSRFRLYFSGTS